MPNLGIGFGLRTVIKRASGTPGPVVFTDNFNRADQSLEASSDWERVGGLANQIRIINNEIVTSATAAANQTAYVPALSKGIPVDHYSEMDWLSTVTQGGMIGVRIADSLNGVFVQKIANTNTVAYKCANGTFTQIGSSTTVINPGDRVRLEAQGTTIRFLVNGTTIITATLGASEFTTGRPGLLSRTSTSNPFGDNYRAGGF